MDVPREFAAYLDLDRGLLEREIRPRVTAEIVEEHRVTPIGKHGDALKVVLRYLRKNQLAVEGKAIVVCTRPHEEWCLAELSAVRGTPPRIDTRAKFRSRGEAEHAVFLKRLEALGLWKRP